MSFVVRRVTLGKAQELFNDLLANLANVHDYEDSADYVNDLDVFNVLSNWLRIEKTMDATDETKMDGQERGF